MRALAKNAPRGPYEVGPAAAVERLPDGAAHKRAPAPATSQVIYAADKLFLDLYVHSHVRILAQWRYPAGSRRNRDKGGCMRWVQPTAASLVCLPRVNPPLPIPSLRRQPNMQSSRLTLARPCVRSSGALPRLGHGGGPIDTDLHENGRGPSLR
jgi:hypothetical protein